MWLTGKKIMENYGIEAEELGNECYRGKLKAYRKGAELFEETKVEKIPRYFPQGVNPRDHIRRGVNVTWNFDWNNEGTAAWAKAYNSGHELHRAFDIYCPENDKIIPLKEHPRLFPFKFEDYIKLYIKREYSENHEAYESPDEDSALHARIKVAYEQEIATMKFKSADVQTCFLNNTEISTQLDMREEEKDSLVKKWQQLIQQGKLSSSDEIAAQLVVEKLNGKTHREAYDAVCPKLSVKKPVEFVSKRLPRAKKLATTYGLSMPNWNSSKS